MDAALWQVTMWRGEGVRVPVSINISGANLEEEDFVQRLKQGLERICRRRRSSLNSPKAR
jgi:EAL domain-containing protein (putative c-di-GMP-specific phosphodiesterase class I)